MWQDWFETYKKVTEDKSVVEIFGESVGCPFCKEHEKGEICGITIRDFNPTAGYRPQENFHMYKDGYDPRIFERLEIFLLKGENDKYPGLMINTISGARYIDIKYCPICGRELVRR